MTAIVALTLGDGQATPANHTFSPVTIDGAGVAKWSDRSSGIALGFPSIWLSLRFPSKTSRNYKAIAKVVVPVLEQTSASTSTGIQPAPTLSYNLVADITMVLPERSTLANRKDMLAYVQNFLASSVFSDMVKNFESVY